MLVLFEVGMLLKGKRADFALKSHLPCYGEGCSVCEKGAAGHPLGSFGQTRSNEHR